MIRLAAFASVIAAVLVQPASAQQDVYRKLASFDGRWSVLIVTEKGNCDRAYRYPLIIQSGSVLYGGRNNFEVSGQVQPNGAVTVRVTQGNYGADGAGRLHGKYGRGTWEAPAGGCSGRWEAERRG